MKLMRPVAMLCALAITLGGVTVLAATQGSQEDPLITLSYLESVFKPQMEEKVDAAAAQGAQALADKLDAAIAEYESKGLEAAQAVFQTKALGKGGSFTPGAGRELLVVSGSVTALGSLTDTTAGKSLSAGSKLEENHLYITADAASGCKADTAATVMSR